MKYAGMLRGMWLLFAGSFRKQLTQTLKYDAAAADGIHERSGRSSGLCPGAYAGHRRIIL